MAPKLTRVGFHWRATMHHDNVPSWDMWLREIQELGIGTLFIGHDASGMRNYNPLTGELDPRGIPTDARPGIEGMIRDLRSIGVEPALRIDSTGGIRANSIPNQVIDGLAKAGVKHIQIWNEPNDDREWKDRQVPKDWAEQSIAWALQPCRHGLSLGLEMSLPPINPGADVNQFKIVVEQGAGEFFERGLAVNIHLYPFNRFTWKGKYYPFDDVNQRAEQLTQEEYAAFDPYYWHGFPREYINEVRRKDARPGATIMQDSDGFLGWLVHEHHMKTALGPNAAVPCRVTEMGPRPWQDLDKRYPRLTPEEHARQVALICRWFQDDAEIGGRKRPSWLKAGYFWILGCRVLGDWSYMFEADAFYGDWNMDHRAPEYNYPQTPIGHMPAIDAIKQLARSVTPAPEPTPEPIIPQVSAHIRAAQGYLGQAREIIAGL
jgi:hypothetical protein